MVSICSLIPKNNLMDGGKMKLCCHSVKNKVIMMKKIIATR